MYCLLYSRFDVILTNESGRSICLFSILESVNVAEDNVEGFVCGALLVTVPFMLLLILCFTLSIFGIVCSCSTFCTRSRGPNINLGTKCVDAAAFRGQRITLRCSSFIFKGSEDVCCRVTS